MKLVVFIEDGALQTVLADSQDCEVLLVDWDVEGSGSAWIVKGLTDTEGEAQGDAVLEQQEVAYDPEGVQHYWAQIPKGGD